MVVPFAIPSREWLFGSVKLFGAVSSFPLGFGYVVNFSFFSSGFGFSVIKSE